MIYVNGTYREMTPEEIAVLQAENNLATIIEKTRPLTESEVYKMFVVQQINTLTVDDNTALRMKKFYPEWTTDVSYDTAFKVIRNGELYRTLQAHTSQAGWEPENVPSLWEKINETHSGTIDDPIPYSGNMALENGKYYMQDYVIYLCIRDTINPVYQPLGELVDIYVEVV